MGYILFGAFFACTFIGSIGDMLVEMQRGDFTSLAVCIIFAVLTFWCLSSALKKKKTLARGMQYLGWFLVVTAIYGFTDEFGSLDGMFLAVGMVVMGLIIVYFARLRKKPEKPAAPEPVENPAESSPAQTDADEGSLSALFAKMDRCQSVQDNPDFRKQLKETQSLFADLEEKEIRVPAFYLDETVKLLDTYLDLDDDPVQTRKTLDLKKQIAGGIDTIHNALKGLYDKHLSTSQIDLESDIMALKMKLRQDGLLDSDFSQRE